MIADNIAALTRRIDRASKSAGFGAGTTRLMAVTKTQTDAAMDAALAAGLRLFGENKVQEAEAHWPPDRRASYPDMRLHLIGPLQTNKAKDALLLFDCIETLDRDSLAAALAKEAAKIREQGGALKTARFLIQINTGEEPQKAGIAPRELKTFLSYCRADCGLNVAGLMCLPPQDEPAGLHFAFLKELARRNGLATLSMGMSEDFEKAAALGASHVRLGSALFGARQS